MPDSLNLPTITHEEMTAQMPQAVAAIPPDILATLKAWLRNQILTVGVADLTAALNAKLPPFLANLVLAWVLPELQKLLDKYLPAPVIVVTP